MKIETHLHSKNGSWCGQLDYPQILQLYKDLGYGGIFLTEHISADICNHFLKGGNYQEKCESYISNFASFEKQAKDFGINAFFGAEITISHKDRLCDVLALNVTPSFFEKNILLMQIDELYSYCKNAQVFLAQAHPFRFDAKPLPAEFLDGVEVYNGSFHQNNNHLALEFAKKYGKIMLSGSDFHEKNHAGRGGIVIPKQAKTAAEVTKYLFDNDFKIITDGAF